MRTAFWFNRSSQKIFSPVSSVSKAVYLSSVEWLAIATPRTLQRLPGVSHEPIDRHSTPLYYPYMNQAPPDLSPPETTVQSGPHWTFSVLHAAQLIEDRIELALGKVGLSMAKHGALTELARAGE